jgi:hypothetical protein
MKNTAPVPEDLRTGLLQMLAAHGETRACHLLRLSRTTISRIVGREPVRYATATHLRHVLVGFELAQPETPKALPSPPYRPVGEFVRQNCILDPRVEILAEELHGAWVRWCQAHGEAPTAFPLFGRDLKKLLGVRLHVARPRTLTGRIRVYQGLRLRRDEGS